jgi:predicted GIY-YIG superfamily endonuclease
VWFVYILRCADNSLYIGETGDVERRLEKHQQGACTYTLTRRPVALAYSETCPTREAALRRECQLKGWTRVKKEALIGGDLTTLKKR